MKSRLPLIVAIILAIIAVLAVRSYIMQEKKKITKGMEFIPVVAAAKDLPKGTKISLSLIYAKKVPKKFVPELAITGKENVISILDREVNRDIRKDELILWTDLGRTKKRTFSQIIPQGERAITIPVDNITGVAGLIQPNDHVDILGTFTTTKQVSTGMGGERTETQMETITLLQNVTVLATGQKVAGVPGENRSRGGYSSVTVSVTPLEAELLIFAQQESRLTLALRNPEDLSVVKDMPRIKFEDVIKRKEKLTEERIKRIEKISGRKVEIIKIREGKEK